MENKTNIYAALAAAQAEIGGVITADEKANFATKKGGTVSYQYASLHKILSVVIPSLTKNGLSLVQLPTSNERGFSLITQIFHSSGESIASEIYLPIIESEESNPQHFGSVLSYMRRYVITAMLGVAIDDDDGAAAAQAAAVRRRHAQGEMASAPASVAAAPIPVPATVTPQKPAQAPAPAPAPVLSSALYADGSAVSAALLPFYEVAMAHGDVPYSAQSLRDWLNNIRHEMGASTLPTAKQIDEHLSKYI